MKKMLNLCLGVSLFVLARPVCADPLAEENRLLKSWGLKFNAQGNLLFRAGQVQQPPHQPWTPDLSAYRSSHTDKDAQPELRPLVISSKQETGK